MEEIHKILGLHYPQWELSNIEIKDCTKGDDNNVFMVINGDNGGGGRIIIRIPKRMGDDTVDMPVMHRPSMQATVMTLYKNAGVPVPSVIALDTENDRYLVESYMPEIDLSDLYSIPSQIPPSIRTPLFNQIGIILSKMHTVQTKQYGYIVDYKEEKQGDTSHGKYLYGSSSNWSEYFTEFKDHCKECLDNDLYLVDPHDTYSKLIDIYNQVLPHLISFASPCLVHADVCSNNIRITSCSSNNDVVGAGECLDTIKVNGVIDFSDAISGDGLYDCGRILSHVYGDWTFIQDIESGYFQNTQSKFTTHQYQMIIFYALSFCCWLLSMTRDKVKYNNVLCNLLNLYHQFKNK